MAVGGHICATASLPRNVSGIYEMGGLCEPPPQIEARFSGIPFVTQSLSCLSYPDSIPPPFSASASPCIPIDLLRDRIMMRFTTKFLYAFIVYFIRNKYEPWSVWDIYHVVLSEERLGKTHVLRHGVHYLPSC